MGLSAEMKNLSEDILASFKQRIIENEELVNDVQKTLDKFHKDHQEMADVLNSNAASLRKGLAKGEKERLNTYKDLMAGIHGTIATIKSDVVAIQAETLELVNEFSKDRSAMAVELNKFFAAGKADRDKNEKIRMKEFDKLMKSINADIVSINEEVVDIFKYTNEILEKFEKDHKDMSAELKADLSKNLAERIDYTRNLLNGFQKRLTEISKENQKMAQRLRKDLSIGETERLNEYNSIMKGIHAAIKGIRTDVRAIKKSTNGMINDFAQDRSQASSEWIKMQNAIAQMRKTGVVKKTTVVEKKAEKKEAVAEPVKVVIAEPAKLVVAEPVKAVAAELPLKVEVKEVAPLTLEEKVLNYIRKNPKGVRVSEMEGPLGETRMKLGFTAKILLDEGKVQKMDNIYFPIK
ncbi:MAG: hypothetical protein WCO63_11200 [Bacteroidota bacterium]